MHLVRKITTALVLVLSVSAYAGTRAPEAKMQHDFDTLKANNHTLGRTTLVDGEHGFVQDLTHRPQHHRNGGVVTEGTVYPLLKIGKENSQHMGDPLK